MNKILIVDDEHSIRESFSLILEGKYQLLLAASGEAALKYVADQKIDLAYLDIRMPGLDGLETLQRLKAIDPQVEVIMVTAVNDVQKASQAIKAGARDYIIKPFDVAAILKMTETLLRRKALRTGGQAQQLVGQSDKMQAIFKIIKNIDTKTTRLLILGEAGTEKEELAQLIHANSAQADLPCRSLTLSAKLTPAEIKTKLFGKGTGTTTADLKKLSGVLDEVRGGTLFINNIAALPADLLTSLPAEIRIIGGGLPDLAEKNKELFDYFSGVLVNLPPLRDRLSDLPLLLNHYLEIYNNIYGKEVAAFPAEVESILSDYAWPGNIAELKVLIRRLVISAQSEQITAADLPFEFLLKSPGSPGADYLALFEQEHIKRIFAETGDRQRSAALLGVNASVLESLN